MEIDFSLGDLVNPKLYHEPIKIDQYDDDTLKDFYRSILKIRLAEQKLAVERKDGVIGGPVHLGVGQEAIAVGVSASLNNRDYIFGAHRSHGHLLAVNPDFYKLFCEVLGRDDGFSKGMGGSMHLWDGASGFMGSVPIVAGTVPLALGTALSSKLSGKRSVSVCYLGDGAVEEGVVHESLNFASVHKLPIVFVVENNLFASHMHTSLRQPADGCFRFALSNKIPFELIDGNDVGLVANVAETACSRCRDGDGPFFIEAVTFRWFGHVDWREDVDVGVNRSQEDIADWRLRDPLKRLEDAMISRGVIGPQYVHAIKSGIEQEIDSSWDLALQAEFPSEKELLSRVYDD
ncbi:MAG: thiamine pyrophosphate-dependent dehydrogenase E1 component subunit alpha [Pseudomonadota bacterium]|nr:thiamine pyrophosphate-dependent dehydrogenase E1 component subunit alpha [Pseudomonadota bacterium]